MESSKKRGENWTSEDKMLLQELVRERVQMIENKNTDTNSNKRKLAAWADLQKSFDTMRNGAQRTVAQLKSQWGSIKIAEKKKFSSEKKQRMATGGGPPPRENPTDSNDIRAWLPQEFEDDRNVFDSDSVCHQASIISITHDKEAVLELEVPAAPVARDNVYDASPGSEVPVAGPSISDTSLAPEAQVSRSSVLDSSLTSEARQQPQKAGPSSLRKRKRQTICRPGQPAEEIAAVEIRCREELHVLQKQNEEKRKENLIIEKTLLELKKELVMTKIDFFKTKMNI